MSWEELLRAAVSRLFALVLILAAPVPHAFGQLPPIFPPPPSGGALEDPSEPVAAPPGEYVTAGANPSRTGEVVDQAIFGPLTRAWSVELGRPYSSQPLVAEGRVLVNQGADLIALEPISGRELWRQEVTGILGAGAGIVVSVQGNELVSAFSIADGQLRWTRQFADTSQGAAPIIAGGVVYVALPEHSGSEGRLHALSATDGSTLWSVRAAGAGGQPAIDSQRIFVSGDCGNTVAYSRNDGSVLWQADVADFTCFDGIASLFDGTLYAGAGYVFDPVSGAQRPQLKDAQKPDAFSAGLGFGGDGSEVKAVALDSGDRRWRRAKGDRPAYQGPLVVGGTVHVTETEPSGRRRLLGLERSSGHALWTARLPPYAGAGGLAAGGGHLVVVDGKWLTAFTPVLKPGHGAPTSAPAPTTSLSVSQSPSSAVPVTSSGARCQSSSLRPTASRTSASWRATEHRYERTARPISARRSNATPGFGSGSPADPRASESSSMPIRAFASGSTPSHLAKRSRS